MKRYSIFSDGEETGPVNAIERAVDLHALRVIGSSGYQKCIKYLWRGWFCQGGVDSTRFVEYRSKDSTDFWKHFHPDRMRTPLYQNVCQIGFSLVYLALYTVVMNTVNPTGDLDIVEAVLYLMTLSFICDETIKLWKIGRHYFDFWNAFNSTLYAILAVSFILRVVALSHSTSLQDERRRMFNTLSYNFLAFAGPMFWMRMMLYLDSFRFFGAMFVVLRVMMKESLIFFALLFVVLVGFFQAFVGMAQVDSDVPVTREIIQGMANSIMQSPEFETFQDFAFPFGIILYYMFNFIVMTGMICPTSLPQSSLTRLVLLNILIALYNSAYEDISGNAIDEYMGLFAQKTMQFIRAPDENVFIPRKPPTLLITSSHRQLTDHAAFNLLEIVFLVLPFEWWLPSHHYAKLNDIVMGIIYSPLLLITASLEVREARRIRWNRRRGEEEDDDVQEWEHVAEEVGFDVDDTWKQSVEDTRPNVYVDTCTLEVRRLQGQVTELTGLVKALMGESGEEVEGGGGSSSSSSSAS